MAAKTWVRNTAPGTAASAAAALQRRLQKAVDLIETHGYFQAVVTMLEAHGYRVIPPEDVTLPETKVGPPTTAH